MLTGKPTRKRSLERPRRRWEESIRTDLKKIGVNTRNLIDSALSRGALMNAPSNSQIL